MPDQVKQLRQLRHLLREIEILQSQIAKAETRIVSDTVTGSGTRFPYTVHTITVTGLDQRVSRLQTKLTTKMQQVVIAKESAVDYILAIDESEIRQILILRYLDGLTWPQVARRMGRIGDGSTERKKHDRYLGI